MTTKLHSKTPVAALIEAACEQYETAAVRGAFSPLYPELSPFTHLSDIDPKSLKGRDCALYEHVTKDLAEYRQSLTHTAGHLAVWLDATEEDIRDLAMNFAKYQPRRMPKLTWATQLLGGAIPGATTESQLTRLGDARFWRRAIRTTLMREREHFFLRLKLVGTSSERYVSDAQVLTRLAQLRRQKQWMEETVLVPRYLSTAEGFKPLTLAAVAGDPRKRFAKLYTFVKAMESLAQDAELVSALVTLTALPEWHPNPSHGESSWNGESPRAAHRHIAEDWNSVQSELYKQGVGISGLRVVEPHQDGCPHWHVWLIYRPEVERDILAALMRQFPGKLKLRSPSRKGQPPHAKDVIYDTRADVLAGHSRPLHTPKEGAQVEVSRIDPSISSGASYAMKYLLKTVDGGEPLAKEVDLFGERVATTGTEDDKKAAAEKRRQHQQAVERVDGWRALWGMNSAMLFGVARCLSAWDELRRLTTPPQERRLHQLWVLARGSDKPGHVAAGSEQRGDAKAFLQALGGITAARDPRDKSLLPKLRLGRLTVEGENAYGDAIQRTKGLQLIERRTATKGTGRVKVAQTVVASVVTRTQEWMLVRADQLSQAIEHATAAMANLVRQGTPEALGERALQHFWSVFHDARMAMGTADCEPAQAEPAPA